MTRRMQTGRWPGQGGQAVPGSIASPGTGPVMKTGLPGGQGNGPASGGDYPGDSVCQGCLSVRPVEGLEGSEHFGLGLGARARSSSKQRGATEGFGK